MWRRGNRRNGSLLDLLSLRPHSFGSPRPALHILLLPLARSSAEEDVLLEGGEAAWAVDCGPWPSSRPMSMGRGRPVRPGGGVLSQSRNGSSRRSHGISHACLDDGVPPGAVVPGEGTGRGFSPFLSSLIIDNDKKSERKGSSQETKQCKRCHGPFRHAARRRQRLPPPDPAAPFDFSGLALILKVRVRVRCLVLFVKGLKIVEIAAVAPLVPRPWHPKPTLTLLPADTPSASSVCGVHPSSTSPPRTTSRLLVSSRPVQSWGFFPLIPTLPHGFSRETRRPSFVSPFLILTRRPGPISIASILPRFPLPAVATAPRLLVCFIRDSRPPSLHFHSPLIDLWLASPAGF